MAAGDAGVGDEDVAVGRAANDYGHPVKAVHLAAGFVANYDQVGFGSGLVGHG
jgi:hypothetical protein